MADRKDYPEAFLAVQGKLVLGFAGSFEESLGWDSEENLVLDSEDSQERDSVDSLGQEFAENLVLDSVDRSALGFVGCLAKILGEHH